MLINAKINDKAQKMLWAEAVHTCARVRNSMANMGSTKRPFEFSMEKNQRLLVHSHSLDLSDTSLNEKN